MELEGAKFDLLVCAGVHAKKWVANDDPKNDAAQIKALTDVLATVTANEIVLISTIDVYSNVSSQSDEDFIPSSGGHHAYGANRLVLEQWVQNKFPVSTIVRLPALFGENLQKNALFDLLNNNQLEKINPAARYQWYPIHRLWDDIQIARSLKIPIVNLFTEPLEMGNILDAYFPNSIVGAAHFPAPNYQLRTRYAGLFGGRKGYVMSSDECLEAIGSYVSAWRDRTLL